MIPTAPQPGLRERKKQATRDALVVAALERFSTDGFEATTVEEIASAAGVSPRTFFRYFRTKDDVVLGEHQRRMATMRERLAASSGTDPLTDALAAVRAYVDDLEHHRWSLQALHQLSATTPAVAARLQGQHADLADAIHAFFRARRRRLVPGRDLEARVAANVIAGAVLGAVDEWLTGEVTQPLRPMAEAALRLARPTLPVPTQRVDPWVVAGADRIDRATPVQPVPNGPLA